MNYFNEVGLIVEAKVFNPVVERYKEKMEKFPASISHHHSESGGYIKHIYEVVKFCIDLTNCLANHQMEIGDRSEKFNIDELINIAFIHDLDKLERYELDPEKPTSKQIKYAMSLGITIEYQDSKSSLSTKIDNSVNNLNSPIQYYRYCDCLVADDSAKVVKMCMELGINLNDEDIHALSFHHGGWSNVRSGKMSPMATILHCADLMSANTLGNKK